MPERVNPLVCEDSQVYDGGEDRDREGVYVC